jgi:CarboxypepD_reg-like domain
MALNLRFMPISYTGFEKIRGLTNLNFHLTVMRALFIILFSLTVLCVKAQRITLSSRVQDKVTSEPLPFASVGIKGKSVGTVTNLHGEFDFHIPPEYRNEILVISMLGYENFEAPLWSLLESKPLTIDMNKSTTVLQEVVVSDSLMGGEIVKIALARVQRNFPMEPFLLDGFYRDIKKVGGTSISLLEAAVKIYDENYIEPRNKEKLRERVRLVEVRKSLGYDNKFAPYFHQRNLLEDLLLHNNIRYRTIDGDEDFFEGLKRESDSYYNGHEIFVVSHAKDFSFKIFIDKQNYAITHLEYEVSGENFERKKNLVSKHVTYHKTLDFKQFEEKMFLNYITVVTKEKWYDDVTSQFKFETELEQHLLINQVTPQTEERVPSTDKMRNYGLQFQDYPYNKKFWDDYNVIKDTPIDKKILADLEQIAPLEKQFENN